MSKRGQNEGSWRQLPSGRWEYRFRVPGEHGSKIRRSVTGLTKEEARKRATEIERAAKKGIRQPAARSIPTLDAWLTEWIDEILPATKRKQATRDQYSTLLRSHIIGKPIGRTKINDLRASKIETAIAAATKRTGEPLSTSSRRSLHAALSAAFEQAVKDRILEDNPMRRVDRASSGSGGRSSKIRALTDEQIDTLLEVTADHRHDTLVRVGLLTGMRRGELIGLRWADIDLDARTITVDQQISAADKDAADLKTAAGARSIDIGDELADLLVTHGAAEMSRLSRLNTARSDLVFTDRSGQALDPRAISRWYSQRAQHAQLEDTGLHALRHTAISRWLLAGIPISVVSSWAGHASPDITLRIYAWALPTQTADYANRVRISHPVSHPLSIGA